MWTAVTANGLQEAICIFMGVNPRIADYLLLYLLRVDVHVNPT